ncbi:MAG: signal peptide peptidase SppA, partial [SAR324 cluster bacterium]|nr:signal peptide peptidase SppA [SAR324 cluster bacterium]
VILIQWTDQGSFGMGHRQIGLIEVNGMILDPLPVVEQIQTMEQLDHVLGVILRIESPGGSVAASQEIHEALNQLRRNKPVYASLGSVAASGGYYIACGTDRIIASAGTLTGSIGVLLEWANLEELGKNAGVKMYRIKSGKYKNVPSLFEEIRENERDLLTGVVDDTHEQFVQAVMKGRPGLEESRVRELADGRVFSGKQAFEAGLVDELGGYASVVRRLSEKLGLSPNEEVFQLDLEDSGISGLLGLASLERWMKQPFSGFRLNYLMH